MKSRDRRAERMSEFVTNMFQYNVTVGITRSEVIFFYNYIFLHHVQNMSKGSTMPIVDPLQVPHPNRSVPLRPDHVGLGPLLKTFDLITGHFTKPIIRNPS